MIKGQIHHEHVTILNVSAPNKVQNTWKKITKLKVKIPNPLRNQKEYRISLDNPLT